MPHAQSDLLPLACRQQGDRVRRAREHANLTQEKLAERSELGRSTIQRVEAGVGIKYTHLYLIARALDVQVAELVVDGPAAATGGVGGGP